MHPEDVINNQRSSSLTSSKSPTPCHKPLKHSRALNPSRTGGFPAALHTRVVLHGGWGSPSSRRIPRPPRSAPPNDDATGLGCRGCRGHSDTDVRRTVGRRRPRAALLTPVPSSPQPRSPGRGKQPRSELRRRRGAPGRGCWRPTEAAGAGGFRTGPWASLPIGPGGPRGAVLSAAGTAHGWLWKPPLEETAWGLRPLT